MDIDFLGEDFLGEDFLGEDFLGEDFLGGGFLGEGFFEDFFGDFLDDSSLEADFFDTLGDCCFDPEATVLEREGDVRERVATPGKNMPLTAAIQSKPD